MRNGKTIHGNSLKAALSEWYVERRPTSSANQILLRLLRSISYININENVMSLWGKIIFYDVLLRNINNLFENFFKYTLSTSQIY